MNRFRIALGREEVFEELWRTRESQLDQVPGFKEFHLLKGPTDEEAALYASHTVWDSKEDFDNWTPQRLGIPFWRAALNPDPMVVELVIG